MLCGLECDRKTLLTSPWLMFLSPGRACGVVVLDQRQADDLVQPFGDNLSQMGAVAAVVFRILSAADECQLDDSSGS